MIQPPARWIIRDGADADRAARLAQALAIPLPVAALLVQRGHDTPQGAKDFLRPDLKGLSDPMALPDMPRAVDVIASAVRSGQTILVHGDYDVDGQCATALLTRALTAAGARVVPFVPHRLRDGYDFGPAGLAAARAHDAAVIVTCDCGITAHDVVAHAKAQGHRVVITDHHLPGDLPPADAVVDTQRREVDLPFRDYCGTGIAFKLVQALVPALGLPENLPFHLIDLVALATIADIVPLTGENRTLVRYGLRKLAASRWLGLRALMEIVGLAGKPIRAGHVGFILAPRLNAAGRIGDAQDGLRLLLTDDPEEARELARKLEAINARRQTIDQEILVQALEHIEQEVDLGQECGLVLAREGWHPGVIGIVASRIVERLARPTILVALEGEEGRGSGRSIPGFDLHAALSSCALHLGRFGGHTMAAGLTIRRDRLQDFKVAFNEVARQALTVDDLIPTRRVDLVVTLGHLDLRLERMLQAMEPCGAGNPAPVLAVLRANARQPRVVGANHVRFVLEEGAARVPAIGFDWADRLASGWAEAPVDVAFRLERDDWQGDARLQARVVDIRAAI